MLNRFCPNCGTEVDETVVFCPTCGQGIDQAAETHMPSAPEWPEPERRIIPGPEPTSVHVAPRPVQREAYDDEIDEAPASPRRSVATTAGAPRPAQPEPVNLPVTLPTTLSGWLIGAGSAVGALGAVLGLFDSAALASEWLLLLALLAVATSVFAAAALPTVPQLRLATLVVVLIAFGMALDRLLFGGGGVATLLLIIGSAAAAIGAILVEVGQDQPLGGA